MAGTERTTGCEICRAASRFWANIGGFDHYRCSGCGHTFVFPKPGQAELDRFYARSDYYENAERDLPRLQSEAAKRANRLLRHARHMGLEPRLLDVGCGTGIFLREAKRKGWNAAGLDRSAALAAIAQRYSGCPISVGIVEAAPKAAGRPFPVVTAWEVLEHTVNPRDFMRALAENVQPGGLLAISTPLGDGLIARMLGVRFPMLSPPDHLSIFSRRSVLKLAGEYGLRVLRSRAFSNIGTRQLASGFARFVLGRQLEGLSPARRITANTFAITCAWAPKLVDAMGQGSEIELLFRKVGA